MTTNDDYDDNWEMDAMAAELDTREILIRWLVNKDIRVSADGSASIRTGWIEDPDAPAGSPSANAHQTIGVWEPLAVNHPEEAKLLADLHARDILAP